MARGSGYRYRRRGEDSVSRRRNETKGGQFDSYIREDIKLYTAKVGDRLIRILPPPTGKPPPWMDKWGKNYEHYGVDLWVHYNVGPDNAGYACPAKMLGKDCPVCEEWERAQREGEDDKYINELRPVRRVLFYLVDRDDEKEGVVAWAAPWTIDRDIVALMEDKRSGEVLYIDDPEEGYDISFERKGAGLKTEYLGLSIARKPSDLGNDAWLEFIDENPLGEVVQFFDYDHIHAALLGKSTKASKSHDEDDDEPSAKSRRGSSRRDGEDEDEDAVPTVEDVHAMTLRQMKRLIRQQGLDIDDDDFEDDAELAEEICNALDLNPPKKSKRARPKVDDDDDDDDAEDERSDRRQKARAKLRKEREDEIPY